MEAHESKKEIDVLLQKFNDIPLIFQKGTVVIARYVFLPIKISLIASLSIPAMAHHKEGHLATLHAACAYHAVTQLKGQILDISFDTNQVANASNLGINIHYSNEQKLDAPEYRSCHVRVLNEGTINTLSFNIYPEDNTAVSTASSESDMAHETTSVSSAEEGHTSHTNTETALETNHTTLVTPAEPHDSETLVTTASQNLLLPESDQTKVQSTLTASSTTTVE